MAVPTTVTTTRFGLTFDYRCPFARNAHEHVLAALDDGAPWEVSYLPFSLNQAHVEPGSPDVWDLPERADDLLAVEVGMVVRDRFPERFPAVHRGLFELRHDTAQDLRDRHQIAAVLERQGLESIAVLDEIDSGEPLERFRKEHEAVVRDHQVFGVPTFVVNDKAAFVRIMTRPKDAPGTSRALIERVLALFEDVPELNEFKHTTVSS